MLCNEFEFNLLKRYAEYVADNSESFLTLEFDSGIYDGTGEGFIDVKAEDVREAVGSNDYGIKVLMVIFHSDRDGGRNLNSIEYNAEEDTICFIEAMNRDEGVGVRATLYSDGTLATDYKTLVTWYKD